MCVNQYVMYLYIYSICTYRVSIYLCLHFYLQGTKTDILYSTSDLVYVVCAECIRMYTISIRMDR